MKTTLTDCGFISGLHTTISRKFRKEIQSLLAEANRDAAGKLPVAIVRLNDDDYAAVLDGRKFFELLLASQSHHPPRRRPRRNGCILQQRGHVH
jgi:hypothetical protein